MIDNSIELEKIIVSPEDELVDILKEIEKTKAKRIILTFAENSDILISPINLKVILDSADSLKKPLIALIVQNPTGVRNAREAGMTVTETSGSIVDSFWNQSEQNMEERIRANKEILKKGRQTAQVVETPPHVHEERTASDREEFRKSIAQALEKSKEEMNKKKKIIEDNGVLLSLDEDIQTKDESPSLLGKSFKNSEQHENTHTTNLKKKVMFTMPKIPFPKDLKGIALKILLPVLLLVALSAYIAYITLPLVKVKIYVQSKGVDIEKTFSGDTKTTDFNSDLGKVPVKKEEADKSASNSTKATGTAYKGSKAEGVVTISYWTYLINGKKVISLKSGTILTAQNGYKYELTTDVQLGAGDVVVTDVPVRASSVGEEYNVAAGQYFTIEGVSKDDASGSNSAAFEGGSKTPYTVLSKSDVDKVVNDLKKNLFKEAQSDLEEKSDDTWTMIDESIVNTVDGDPQTDVPVGAEADTVNITVKTKTTALFYQKNAIDSSINGLLTKAAQDKGLFEGTDTNQLKLEENLTKSITISELKKDSIKVSVKASSNIQPDINKDDLINQLKGKDWNAGIAIIQSLKLTDKENTAEFLPDYFPQWLRYFPRRQGRLFIDIVQNTEQ